jgi:hypothetical protein
MTTPQSHNPHRTSVGQLKNGDQVPGYVRIPPDEGKAHLRPILAIDPGTSASAYCMWNGSRVLEFGWIDNAELRMMLRHNILLAGGPVVAIEMIASQGMAVGQSTFETVYWIGRFAERVMTQGYDVKRITRHAIKMHLCGSMRAKDANIRQALIDRFGEVGTKKSPGPLYGVKSHIWAALAVAVTTWDSLHIDDTAQTCDTARHG